MECKFSKTYFKSIFHLCISFIHIVSAIPWNISGYIVFSYLRNLLLYLICSCNANNRCCIEIWCKNSRHEDNSSPCRLLFVAILLYRTMMIQLQQFFFHTHCRVIECIRKVFFFYARQNNMRQLCHLRVHIDSRVEKRLIIHRRYSVSCAFHRQITLCLGEHKIHLIYPFKLKLLRLLIHLASDNRQESCAPPFIFHPPVLGLLPAAA